MLNYTSLIKLIEVNVNGIAKFDFIIQLLDGYCSVLLLDVEYFRGTFRNNYIGVWNMNFLECYILNRTILQAYLFKPLFGNLYLIGDQYLI